jgi:hypothetical protein
MSDWQVLRSIQSDPRRFDGAQVAGIIVRAIAKLPALDILAVKYMLTPAALQNELVGHALQLAEMLEAGMYKEFWNKAKGVQGLDSDGVRMFILSVLNRTYQKINVQEFGELLNLEDKALLEQFLSKNKLAVEGNMVQFNLNVENQTHNKVVSEDIPYERLQKLL